MKAEAERAKREMEQSDETPENTEETMSTDEKSNGETADSIDAETDELTERFEIAHHGGSTYFVFDTEKTKSYMAKMEPKQSRMEVVAEGGRMVTGFDREVILGAVIKQAPERRSVGELQADNVANMMNNARSLQQHALESVKGNGHATSSNGSAGDSGGSNGGTDDAEDDEEGEVSETVTVEHTYGNGSELVDSVREWFEQYSELKGELDVGCMEFTFGEAEQEPGVIIDSNPFASGYHTGDAWEDKEGYDAHQDAVKSITQGEDGILYYGEPDWVNFVPARNVNEVTG